MIQTGTRLKGADNTGAKTVECIKVIGGSKRRYANIGDVIVVCIKDAKSSDDKRAKIDVKKVYKAVVVRTRQGVRRNDGSRVKFGENAVVLLNNQGQPMGSRVFGPVTRELRSEKFKKIISLAPEVL